MFRNTLCLPNAHRISYSLLVLVTPQTLHNWVYACFQSDVFQNYSIFVNNDERRIWYVNASWPRSTLHDRVFQNSRIVQKLDTHFQEETEYILGDSAYGPQILWSQCTRSQWAPPYSQTMKFSMQTCQNLEWHQNIWSVSWREASFFFDQFGCNLPVRRCSKKSFVTLLYVYVGSMCYTIERTDRQGYTNC
jgi:hypothetical protein